MGTRLYVAVVVAAALTGAALGIGKGSIAAGDGDSFGYVSQADLIAHGSLRIEQQFVRTMPWPFADWSFAPAGYRPATIRGFIVPTYPPGLPLVMALFQRLAGARAVFLIVPLLGALAIWMTAELGRAVHGPLTGALAAIMLASSPTFLFQLMQPMSDVPATAWWCAALVLALKDSRLAGLGAGIATGMAILTRPNIVPLAAVVGSFFVWKTAGLKARTTADVTAGLNAGTRSDVGQTFRSAVLRLALFTAPSVAACLAVAAINQYLYGSPLSSGYEPFRALYDVANLLPNLDRYPRWLLQTETPFIFLAFAAPWLARRGVRGHDARGLARESVMLLLAFAAVTFLCYVFYVAFGRDEWTYLRFLLPAFPALIVLAVAVVVEAARRLSTRARAAAAASTLVCVVVSAALIWISAARGVFNVRNMERRYLDVGRHIAALLPANSIFFAKVHAGSIRHYSGRLTIQYEWLERRWLDQAVSELRARGYHPFFALEDDEEMAFRERFGGMNQLGRLDWPPAAERHETVRVRIFDPADRERHLRGEQIVTRSIERARGF